MGTPGRRPRGKKELAASPTAPAAAVPACTRRPRPKTRMYQVAMASAAHIISTIYISFPQNFFFFSEAGY